MIKVLRVMGRNNRAMRNRKNRERRKRREKNKRDSRVSHYYTRGSIIEEIGYDSYDTYLKSELWRSIRGRVLKIHSYKCRICKGKAGVVHHQSYDKSTLVGNTLKELIPLCKGCHDEIEFTKKGKKRSFGRVVMYCEFLIEKADKRREETLGEYLHRVLPSEPKAKTQEKLPEGVGVTVVMGRVNGARPRCPLCSRALAMQWNTCQGCNVLINWTKERNRD